MDILASLPLLQIHITAVCVTLALVVVSDLHGLLWLLGKKQTLPRQRMEFFHRAIWTGLVIIMTAGISMFIFSPSYYVSLWAFRFKMLFVLLLVINAFLIGKHLSLAHEQPFSKISATEKRALFLSAAISTVCWIGAYVCAQLLS